MFFAKTHPRTLHAPRPAVTCMLMVLAVLLAVRSTGIAAPDPKAVAKVALYQGPDREKILIQGAKREGNLTAYIVNSWIARTVSKEFEKKYPFIKVSVWQSQSDKMIPRVTQEFAAGQLKADVIEISDDVFGILNRQGVFQEYYTPEAAYYPDEVKEKGKAGLYGLGSRELHNSLGFNTKLIPPSAAPKNYQDLLDPLWKGRMSVCSDSIAVKWVGMILNAMGMEYLEKLRRQDVKVQMIGAGALGNLVVSGEVPLSPTITDFTLFNARKQGAPVEWRPLDPVLTNSGLIAITTRTDHPHAAMLFIDYLSSKEGQNIVLQGGLSSPRSDIGGLSTKFKKNFVTSGLSPEEFEKKYSEWEGLLKRLFIQKR